MNSRLAAIPFSPAPTRHPGSHASEAHRARQGPLSTSEAGFFAKVRCLLGSCVIATLVSAGACAARTPRSSTPATVPTAPRQIHAEIRDSSVDALPDSRVPVSPDIVQAIVDVGQHEVVFRLRHRPGSFDAATTRLTVDLDTDQNAATGSAGIEYHVFVFPAGGKGADVARATSTGYTVVGTVVVSFVADGCDVAVPLSLLGSDDGRFDFRVRVYAQPTLPLVLDVLPDIGFVRLE
jgi:hypothetical protein